MRSKKRTKKIVEWMPVTLMRGVVTKPRQRLTLVLMVGREGGSWQAGAVELADGKVDKTEVFPEHTHVHIGSFETGRLALQAADRYAKKWAAARPAAPCPCGPIKPPRKARLRRSRKA